MKRIALVALAALVLIPVTLFLFMKFGWDAKNHEHASEQAIEQYLQAKRVAEIGKMESDLLETPRLYGYLVDNDGQDQVVVFEQEFGTDQPYLVILPGQPLTAEDRQEEEKIKFALAVQDSLQILSRHEVLRVVEGKRTALPQPFYKVTFRYNQASFLVFYQDEQNKISTFEAGYEHLKNF